MEEAERVCDRIGIVEAAEHAGAEVTSIEVVEPDRSTSPPTNYIDARSDLRP